MKRLIEINCSDWFLKRLLETRGSGVFSTTDPEIEVVINPLYVREKPLTMAEQLIKATRIKTEDKNRLKKAISDIIWMARRYAEGRRTYAVSMFNEAQEILRGYLGEDVVGSEDKTIFNFPFATDGDDIEKSERVNF